MLLGVQRRLWETVRNGVFPFMHRSPALGKASGRVPGTEAAVFWRYRLKTDSLGLQSWGGGEAGRWLAVRGTPENLVSIEHSQARA